MKKVETVADFQGINTLASLKQLNATDFAQFFDELWGHPPFAWQQALADRVLERAEAPWPEAIALPTAAGKTACLDIAVFALAAQASRLARKQAITAPRRVFLVVDRRVIVDQAYERARLRDPAHPLGQRQLAHKPPF